MTLDASVEELNHFFSHFESSYHLTDAYPLSTSQNQSSQEIWCIPVYHLISRRHHRHSPAYGCKPSGAPKNFTIMFANFSSAFNTVIPHMLVEKLDIPLLMCSWIKNFFSNCPQVVKLVSIILPLWCSAQAPSRAVDWAVSCTPFTPLIVLPSTPWTSLQSL